MRIEDAELTYPGYKEYPNIKSTDSLKLMQIAAGWNTKLCIRVGDTYYYLKDHPQVHRLNKKKKRSK